MHHIKYADHLNVRILCKSCHARITCSHRLIDDTTRQNMSNAKLGHIPWNKGKTGYYKHSKKTKQKISLNNTGKHINRHRIYRKDSTYYMSKINEHTK